MIYDFHCESCGSDLVIECKISEYDEKCKEVKCQCGASMKQIIKSVNFQLIGPRWARDSYSGGGGE